MRLFFLVLHLLVTLAMIGLVLLQKGEDVNASQGGGFNPGSSGKGSKNILTRATAILATIFFANCLLLAVLVRQESRLEPHVPGSVSTQSQPVVVQQPKRP